MTETTTATETASPDYLPARMLNEFVYCPRLFYYEWVEGVFAENRETVEGAIKHAKVDAREDALAPAEELGEEDTLHARSVQLSSETHGLIAKIDLVETDGKTATPVDYKRGSPRKNLETGQPEAWDPERVQIAVQALVLRDNGYTCDEGVIYFVATKQRVRIPIDAPLIEQTVAALADAKAAAASNQIPPPLQDSPKCPRCSLVGICLPDETWACRRSDESTAADPQAAPDTDSQPASEPRRLVPARDDLRPLYLNTQGLYVGKSGNVLKVKEKDKVVQEVRIGETCQVNLFGNIQVSTQAMQALCENEVPVAYFSMGGWFYGMTHGLGVRNIALRRQQFRLADHPAFCLDIAKQLVAGKIRNQRTMLQRNHIDPPAHQIALLKCSYEDAERAESIGQLLGIEGNAARIYFELFPGMIKLTEPGDDTSRPDRSSSASEAGPSEPAKPTDRRHPSDFNFDFTHRNRRPPRDPVNALLSLAYSVLAKDLTIVCHAVGFDPFLGFYHQPRFGRAALPLDLMEPFRPLIADSAVLSAINTRMLTPRDFIRAGNAVALKPEGRKAFFRAYEQRMDTLVTHPLFGYRVNYRRVLEIQARLLARVLTGEIKEYPVFVTR
jgi:CRISPR-associated protein Cas1